MKEVKKLSENISNTLPSNLMVIGILFFIIGTAGIISGNNIMMILFVLGIVFIAKASKNKGREVQGDDI